MATRAFITEFADWPTQDVLTIPKWSSRVVEQAPIADITTSQQSAAFGANTRYIMFSCDGVFHWTIGSNPTATTSKFRCAADTIYHIEVQPTDKIAFIAGT
ncbi:hypothetical protein [Bradyrhizobium sp. 930_D9_N1_4]|uniref:hypothetical protein n=1 Tax=Bradyrhizobium sp. 930_D9_N1_4 TaxID=3240374 RepID=UPI003F897AF7